MPMLNNRYQHKAKRPGSTHSLPVNTEVVPQVIRGDDCVKVIKYTDHRTCYPSPLPAHKISIPLYPDDIWKEERKEKDKNFERSAKLPGKKD